MLGRLQDTLRIKNTLAKKGIMVTSLEAYDSWMRYSLSLNQEWVPVRNKDSAETIYRRVKNHIQTIEEPIVLLKVKDRAKERIYQAFKELDNLGRQEFKRMTKYRHMLSNLNHY